MHEPIDLDAQTRELAHARCEVICGELHARRSGLEAAHAEPDGLQAAGSGVADLERQGVATSNLRVQREHGSTVTGQTGAG